MRKPWILPIAIGLLGLGSAGPARAAIYRWVDAQGQVHFSDHPAGGKAQKLEIHNNVTPEQQREAERITETYQRLDKEYDREKAVRQAKEKARERARARRKTRCRELAKQANIANRYALVRIKQDGSPDYLTDKQVKAYKRRLRTMRQKYCAGH